MCIKIKLGDKKGKKFENIKILSFLFAGVSKVNLNLGYGISLMIYFTDVAFETLKFIFLSLSFEDDKKDKWLKK